MKRDDEPDVVDLKRYRHKRAEAAKRPPPKPTAQPVLGGRRNAGLILVAVVLVLLALWLGPRFL